MYHALYANKQEFDQLLDEEKPYAISTEQFEKHLLELKQQNINIISPKELLNNKPMPKKGVIITFDDGHLSHFTHAYPLLVKHKVQAFFFVTTGFMENDPRFCRWEQLKMMANAGMAIHGHGHTHGFFADMSTSEAEQELQTSVDLITENTGVAPWSMSFPGGRFEDRDYHLAKEAGYHHIFTSEIAAVSQQAYQGDAPIPRFAIRNKTTLSDFRQMIEPTQAFLKRQALHQMIKKSAKKILGHGGYHKIYELKARINGLKSK